MTKQVHGHILPPRLVELIEAGSWRSRAACDFSALPIEDREDLLLLDLAGMERNTQSLKAAFAGRQGGILGLTDSSAPAAGLLAVDLAVLIAVTYGQEGLALDYSVGERPRVVATSGSTWVEVAPSIEVLVELIRLPGR